ncbi:MULTISPECIES: hypothetical protein [Acinetobacter calcoaceticus/baumannii complex]|uniref:hypothetical protein n=1 Tax=Acinetobacter calcoaceticus/baumannii complex TaxID=909768 RepID=UPI00083E22C8|nr:MULTISPECIES: hypothetical protein [Acinetobacter calcoaceticus/baumannii complex]MBU3097095.1 HNH endonuclease [Acinetobacter baumannii]MCU4430807.1 HNH endonuclease [Acinetobacter pittii]MCU4532572.1 HNH endonuclease [Acinetobacter pittii]ODI96273.1 hypothetical protein BFR91_04255 [Acinetobacter pittii]SSU98554.1 Uncharacterised protein [Acinetobacter baumannii]
MINLLREPKPSYLSESKVTELTKEFIDNGTNVWNHDEIKVPLLKSSHNKCAYCECYIHEESKYMEVEHFEDKHHNPTKVVEWDNLLPSCKKCNGAKSTHDVISEPIVNPYIDHPKEHLAFKLYRLKGITEKGKTSIIVNNLNDHERMVQVRFDIGEKIQELLCIAEDQFEQYKLKRTTVWRNKLLTTINGLLNECLPQAQYSAISATVTLTDDLFKIVKKGMEDEGLWNQELQRKFNVASGIQLLYL